MLKHSAGGIAARRARRSRLRENSSWVQQEKSAFAVSRRTESSLTGASRETRKSHEKSRKNCLPGTDHSLYANKTRAFSPVLGCDKSFVTFRETFVSRCAAETPEGWRLRKRQRPSLLESSDARADSNRPSGRFRGAAGFRGSCEAPVRLHEHKTFTALVIGTRGDRPQTAIIPHLAHHAQVFVYLGRLKTATITEVATYSGIRKT